jgi:subtilase family serine protease
VPPSTRLHVTVTLRPRDAPGLATYARAVSTPGSALYRHYLTPAQFGRRFGATAAQIAAVRASLRARGLRPGAASAGGLSIPVSATAAALHRAFGIALRDVSLRGRRAEIAPTPTATATAAASLPARLSPAVQSVLGIDGAGAPQPLLVRPHAGAAGPLPVTAHVATGGAQPCATAQAGAPGQFAYTADQIASAYGFTGLYASGDLGQGVTVAVYELEPDDPSDIAAYQACYGTHAAISYDEVDGGAGSGPGAGEAALDIENLIGLAPDVNVIVYQGPNSDSGAPGSGPYDTFSAIINQDRANVISVSWGECEAMLGATDALAEDTLFQQAAVQGQTVIAASGDSGAEDCDSGGPRPHTELAVDDPSSQPFVTGVGGTSLSALGPRPSETVWNSAGSGSASPPQSQPGAGGGGVSALWPMGPAQLDAAPSLGVRTAVAAAGATCDAASGYCREVPDVAADADPNTGYLIYWNGADQVAGQPSGWQGIGGTSAAAPVWAAVLALADGSQACDGAPLGYVEPALYRAAGTDYAADFNDVTTGNNDFTQTNEGRFAATAGYDLASGLGSPNAAALAADLCADTVTMADPGSQRSALHATLRLAIQASGSGLSYHATHLPPGLTLGPASGEISGSPVQTGTFSVRVIAQDPQDATASAAFHWTVGGAPRISRVSWSATASGQPVLAFTLSAARTSPKLQTIQLSLPRDLRLRSRRGVTVTYTFGRRLRAAVSVSRQGVATIRLAQPAGGVRVTLVPPSLTTVAGRIPSATSRVGRRLTVAITDADAGHSRLSAEEPS